MGKKPGFRALLIAGPTASGKTDLALRLARRLDAQIINADSMQVYRDLRIITARPTPAEETLTPHSLFGFVDAAVNYSVGSWLTDAGKALDEATARGRIAIIVGGTGLYFKALTQGLPDMPSVAPDIRERVRREAQNAASPELHARLTDIDPQLAGRLRPNDRQRILRALEFFASTGEPLSRYQNRFGVPLLRPPEWLGSFLAPERAALRARIDARFEEMVASGALDEARALAERKLDPALPVMRAHGIPGLLAHIRGEISLEAALARGQADTRRYVKRQFTFARHQLPQFAETEPEAAEEWILRALDA